MKKFPLALFVVVLFSLLFDNTYADSAGTISSDASIILSVDMGKVRGKLGEEGLEQLDKLAQSQDGPFQDENENFLLSILDDPASKGIDSNGKALISVKFGGADEDPEYTGIMLPLADTNLFSIWIKELGIDINFSGSKGGLNYMGSMEFAVGWDSNEAVIVYSSVYENQEDMEARLISLLQTDIKESLSGAPGLTDFYHSNADAALWIDGKAMERFRANLTNENGIVGKYGNNINAVTAAIDFEEESMTLNARIYSESNGYSLYSRKPSREFLDSLEGKDFLGILTFSLNMEHFQEYFNDLKLEEQLGREMKEAILSLSEYLDGDFVVVLSEFLPEKDKISVSLTASVRDENGLKDLFSRLEKKGFLGKTKNKNVYIVGGNQKRAGTGKSTVYMILKGKSLIIASADDAADIIRNKRQNFRIPEDKKQFIQENDFSFYLDYVKLSDKLVFDQTSGDDYMLLAEYLKGKLETVKLTVNPSKEPYQTDAGIRLEFSKSGRSSILILLDWLEELSLSSQNGYKEDY